MSVTVKEHVVAAVQIEQVRPLRQGGTMVGPDAGVILVLADQTKHRWLIEDGAAPQIGSWLVNDATLHTHYVVSPEKFAAMFAVVDD